MRKEEEVEIEKECERSGGRGGMKESEVAHMIVFGVTRVHSLQVNGAISISNLILSCVGD